MSEHQASVSLIAEGSAYELLGTPDKASFILRSKADLYTDWKPDQTLAQLWDQGGYSWLAAQDGE
jgi:hypothetical protein